MVQRKKGDTAGRQRAVIFDFDGTMADTFPAVIEVFEEVTKQPRPLTKDEIKKFQHLSAPELIDIFQVPKWKIPYLFFRGRRMLRSHMNDVSPHSGVDAVVKQLHADGVKLYIVSSNSTENIRNYLEKYELSEYFLAVYGSASPFAKSRKLLQLIDKEQLSLEDTWCVGDETRDVSAAHAVGLKIVSVSWGYNSRQALVEKQPEALADTATELLDVLQDAWKK